jgi:hypothetical protein
MERPEGFGNRRGNGSVGTLRELDFTCPLAIQAFRRSRSCVFQWRPNSYPCRDLLFSRRCY